MALSLTLAACQTMITPSEEIEETQTPSVAQRAPAPEPIVYGNFTPDQLNRVILNELGGQRGYLPDATQDYYSLAMETQDLGVIRRASQFASALGDTEAMIELGRLWIDKAPNSVEPHIILSYQLLESGRLAEAMSHMRRVLELGGNIDFTAVTGRTETLSATQREGVIAGVRELRVDYPDNRSLHYALIQLLEQSELPNPAMEELTSFRNRYGNSARVLLLEAQLLLQMGQLEKSIAVLANGIDDYPDNRLIRFNYARVLVQTGDLTNARQQFGILAEMSPDDYETLYSMALLDLELNSLSNAKRTLTRLLGVNYRINDAHFYLGYVGENERNFREAIEHYKQVRLDSNNFVAAQRQAIRLMIEEESFDEAHSWAITVSEGNPRLQVLLATVETDALMAEGHLERARNLLDQTIARYPGDTDLLFARSLVSERLGDMVAAEADLRIIIDLQPENARALNHLGYTLADRTDRHEEALALLERAIAISPDDPAIIDSLAWAQYKVGLYEEALTNLQRAYAVFPDHEVASHLGEVLWMMGRRSEANKVWDDALRERPDSDLLKNVIERFRNGTDS
ncbi:MAG: tetratricopeptide repeat protein [Gammaproteobacteria bacterium]|nr:tetratricopeptide repeat protein [Gammaproteobacteria bacterium]MDP2142307.1 tetratricopeptide repeat protein [Gammaproteobacteria bacterium]MDP2348548.1 tetratricopeptide repeat protein [Gammaproteobacteria bacterium]